MAVSTHSARRLPDGRFEVDGRGYALREIGDGRFEVVASGQTAGIGEIVLSSGRAAPKVTSHGDDHRVLQAIATLLGQPRGSLPLQ